LVEEPVWRMQALGMEEEGKWDKKNMKLCGRGAGIGDGRVGRGG
jgi:hypothetical protein